MEIKRKHRYALSILSGILMVLSFPFTGSLTPLAFIAWIPILIVEDNIHRSGYRPRKLFIHAYLTFLIYNLGTTWWVVYASAEGATMAFVVNSLLMALVFQLFHFTKRRIGKKEGYIALVIYWIGFEYFHLNWESSWPWLTLGNVFSIRTSWIQWYDYTGALGGSIWILIVNLTGFRIVQNLWIKKETLRIQTPLFYVFGFLLIAPIGLSLIRNLNYIEKGRNYSVVAVQPNVDPYNEKFAADVFSQLNKVRDLAQKKLSIKTDLIVAPETAISMSFDEDQINTPYTYANNIQQYFLANRDKLKGKAICIGASTHRFFDDKNSHVAHELNDGRFIEYYNTSALIDSAEFDFIHKSKLVPGVEKIPFASTFPFLEDLSIDLGGTTGTLGVEKEPQVFDVDGVRFAPVICYESIYGEFVAQQCRKGAQFICIITNDGWWKDTPGYKQHASFARLRAIENRRSVVRSANTGTSCFITQNGIMQQATEWWTADVISKDIKLNEELTFYSRFGDFFGRSFGFVAILLFLYSLAKPFSNRLKRN